MRRRVRANPKGVALPPPADDRAAVRALAPVAMRIAREMQARWSGIDLAQRPAAAYRDLARVWRDFLALQLIDALAAGLVDGRYGAGRAGRQWAAGQRRTAERAATALERWCEGRAAAIERDLEASRDYPEGRRILAMRALQKTTSGLRKLDLSNALTRAYASYYGASQDGDADGLLQGFPDVWGAVHNAMTDLTQSRPELADRLYKAATALADPDDG